MSEIPLDALRKPLDAPKEIDEEGLYLSSASPSDPKAAAFNVVASFMEPDMPWPKDLSSSASTSNVVASFMEPDMLWPKDMQDPA